MSPFYSSYFFQSYKMVALGVKVRPDGWVGRLPAVTMDMDRVDVLQQQTINGNWFIGETLRVDGHALAR